MYVWAAGNGRGAGDNVNYDGYASRREVIAVGALDGNDRYAGYSEPGAAMLVAAPADGVVTTDRMGAPGYSSTDCHSAFNGTSAAAPVVSGVIALMLQANPGLTWRDVQHILVKTAVQNDPGDAGWTVNGAGLNVNHDYGFGRVNAALAVQLAQSWTNVAAETAASSGLQVVGELIPDNDPAGLTRTVNITQDVTVEHVEVAFHAPLHSAPGQLEVTLTSPSGTVSRLALARSNNSGGRYSNWVFQTVRSWDESSVGNWTLNVADRTAGTMGTWENFSITVYGTPKVGPAPTLTCTGGPVKQALAGVVDFAGCSVDLPGTYRIMATTTTGLVAATSDPFVVSGTAAAPLILDITPGFAKAGGSWSDVVRVMGTGFLPGAKVFWDGAEKTTQFISATEVRFTLDTADYATAGDRDVSATNPGSAASNLFVFDVLPNSRADVDCDLDVDASDPLRVLQVLAGTGSPGAGCSADVDDNGVPQPADALYGLRVVAGQLPQ